MTEQSGTPVISFLIAGCSWFPMLQPNGDLSTVCRHRALAQLQDSILRALHLKCSPQIPVCYEPSPLSVQFTLDQVHKIWSPAGEMIFPSSGLCALPLPPCHLLLSTQRLWAGGDWGSGRVTPHPAVYISAEREASQPTPPERKT